MSDEQLTPEEEIKQLRDALAKANKEAGDHRHRANDLETQLEEYKEKYADAQRGRLEATISSRLRTEGVENPERVVKLMNLSGGEDEDELESSIKAIKEDLPELFDPKRRATPIDAADKPAPKPNASTSDVLASKILAR